MAETAPVKYRVGWLLGSILVVLALFFDLLELILAVVTVEAGSFVLDFIEQMIFLPILWWKKVPPWKGGIKKIGTWLAVFATSSVPFVGDVMPELAIGVFLLIFWSRVEDRTKTKHPKLNSKITRARRVRVKVRG